MLFAVRTEVVNELYLDPPHRADGGSPDPEQNKALAAALRRAKDSGVPKDNIENALKKVRDSTWSGSTSSAANASPSGCRREGQGRRASGV